MRTIWDWVKPGSHLGPSLVPDAKVIIVSYNRLAELFREFHLIKFDCAILDEAHFIEHS